MKKIITLLLIIISNSTFAQNCNIGNEDPIGFNNSNDPFWENYLLGVKFNLSTNGVLTSLNLIGRNTGAQVQLAVYEDIAGVPGNLVVSSSAATVGAGIISIPVTPIQLFAGNYWIMGVYDNDGGHTYNKDSTGNTVYYQSLFFGDPIPSNASSFISYTGYDFTYYMGITCGTLGISDNDNLNNISIYPNPAIDLVTITGVNNLIDSNYIITDLVGKQVLAGKLSSETSLIDIRQLNAGVYLLQVGPNRKQTLKLIKE
jgi:hypothetical protein